MCIHVVNCKVASLLWFVHFGVRSNGGAQLLSCSHLVDHTCIFHVFWMNLIDDIYIYICGGIKHGIFCASLPLLLKNLNSKGLFVPIFSLEIVHLPCFKILQMNIILTLQLVSKNSTTNIK